MSSELSPFAGLVRDLSSVPPSHERKIGDLTQDVRVETLALSQWLEACDKQFLDLPTLTDKQKHIYLQHLRKLQSFSTTDIALYTQVLSENFSRRSPESQRAFYLVLFSLQQKMRGVLTQHLDFMRTLVPPLESSTEHQVILEKYAAVAGVLYSGIVAIPVRSYSISELLLLKEISAEECVEFFFPLCDASELETYKQLSAMAPHTTQLFRWQAEPLYTAVALQEFTHDDPAHLREPLKLTKGSITERIVAKDVASFADKIRRLREQLRRLMLEESPEGSLVRQHIFSVLEQHTSDYLIAALGLRTTYDVQLFYRSLVVLLQRATLPATEHQLLTVFEEILSSYVEAQLAGSILTSEDLVTLLTAENTSERTFSHELPFTEPEFAEYICVGVGYVLGNTRQRKWLLDTHQVQKEGLGFRLPQRVSIEVTQKKLLIIELQYPDLENTTSAVVMRAALSAQRFESFSCEWNVLEAPGMSEITNQFYAFFQAYTWLLFNEIHTEISEQLRAKYQANNNRKAVVPPTPAEKIGVEARIQAAQQDTSGQSEAADSETSTATPPSAEVVESSTPPESVTSQLDCSDDEFRAACEAGGIRDMGVRSLLQKSIRRLQKFPALFQPEQLSNVIIDGQPGKKCVLRREYRMIVVLDPAQATAGKAVYRPAKIGHRKDIYE